MRLTRARPVRSLHWQTWRNTLAALTILTLISIAAGYINLHLGWFSALCGLLWLLLRHVRRITQLADWIDSDTPYLLPAADNGWLWRALFTRLNTQTQALREARDELAHTLERHRAASEALPDGVIYLTGNGQIEWLNQRAANHFDLDTKRDLGIVLTALVRDSQLQRYLQAPDEAPLAIQSPRRPEIALQIQVIPFGNQQKMVLSRDVTQLGKLETMRRDFIANVSHELRTPLTIVGGFLETIMDSGDELEPEAVRRYLNIALEQSGRMRHLIEDLLTLSALETTAPYDENVALAELLAQIYSEACALSGSQHQISCDFADAEHCELIGTTKELHSAFANLVSNAVRYTPAPGAIHITWHCSPEQAIFSVQDNGIGIAAEHIPRITERFFRVDSGRSRETGGTGLGLAIVKHVLSRHQAHLEIDSEAGTGSRFSAVFPAHRLQCDWSQN